MEFDDKLKAAIDRGRERRAHDRNLTQQRRMTEAELRTRHNEIRLRLSEHIERSIRKLIEPFPGFQFEVIYGERGWGAAIYRDDQLAPGRKAYSRLEMYVRPLSALQLVDLFAKGTVRNRELFSRNSYQEIEAADLGQLERLVDTWVLEYAELFASQ